MTRSFYRQQVATTRTQIGKDTRDAAVNKAVHTAGSLWPGLQLIQWSELHNIPGITAYTAQTLLRLKANRLSMWNYEKVDLSCSNPECSQVVQSSVQHLFWECPKAKLVWNYFYALWAKIGITPGHDPAIWIFSLDLPDTPRHAWTTIKRHIIGHKCSNEHLQDHLYSVAHMLWRYMSASLIQTIWCAHLRRMDSDPIESTSEMAIMMTRLEAGMRNLTRLAEAQAGDSDGHTVAAVLKAYVDCFLSQTDAIPLTPSDTRGVYLLFFDGGSRGNPGPGGTGSIIVRVHKDSHTASLIWAASMAYSRKDTTNNFAEYWGLIHGLREAQRSHFEPFRQPSHGHQNLNAGSLPNSRAAFNNLTQDLDNDVMHWLMRMSDRSLPAAHTQNWRMPFWLVHLPSLTMGCLECLSKVRMRLRAGYHGHYSVERMCEQTSLSRALLVATLFIVPSLTTIVLLDALPLQDPFSGWDKNMSFWIRVALGTFALGLGMMSQMQTLVPAAGLTLWNCVVVAVCCTTCFTVPSILVAKYWVFPIPFMMVVCNPPFSLGLFGSLFVVIGKKKLNERPEIKVQLQRLSNLMNLSLLLIIVYSVYNAIFLTLSGTGQFVFVFVLPVIKYLLKIFLRMKDVQDCTRDEAGKSKSLLLIGMGLADAPSKLALDQLRVESWTNVRLSREKYALVQNMKLEQMKCRAEVITEARSDKVPLCCFPSNLSSEIAALNAVVPLPSASATAAISNNEIQESPSSGDLLTPRNPGSAIAPSLSIKLKKSNGLRESSDNAVIMKKTLEQLSRCEAMLQNFIMERPRGEIWSLYEEDVAISQGKGQPDVKCKFCSILNVNAQSRNMLPHAIVCPGLTSVDKQKWIALHKKKEKEKELRRFVKNRMVNQTPSIQRHSNTQTPSPRTITKRLFQTSSKSSRRSPRPPTTKRRTRAERHLAVARTIIATGVAFRVVEDKYFRAMFDDENDVPSRFQVAGELLDQVYKSERESVLKGLGSTKSLCIVIDGWSSRQNESIINYILVNPFIKPIIWKSFATGEASHDADYIADQILHVINEIDALLGRKIVRAVVTDNAANMKSAWKKLEGSGRGLICNGCASHAMNLLMKDVFKLEYFSWVLDRAKSLTNFVKQRHALLDRFRSLQKSLKGPGDRRRALSMPVATRWYSCEACIRSVVDNRNAIAATFADEEFLRKYQRSGILLKEAKDIVGDAEFWQRASLVIKVVKPINECLATFEKDNCCISMINHLFNWLDDTFSKPVGPGEANLMRAIHAMTTSRKEFLFTTSMKAAYVLDQSKPVPSSGDDTINIIASTAVLAERIGLPQGVSKDDVHRQLVSFVQAKMNWTTEKKEKHSMFSPLDWWSFSTAYPAVKGIAMHVLSIPTSSAASERSWSIHSFTQSQRRNLLSSDRLDKLVFVYCNLGDKSASDHILYDLYAEAEDFIENREGETSSLDAPELQTVDTNHESETVSSFASAQLYSRDHPACFFCEELEEDLSSQIASANRLAGAAGDNSDEGNGGIPARAQQVVDYIGEKVIGLETLFESPYGKRALCYADSTASGKSLRCVEEYIQREVLPLPRASATTPVPALCLGPPPPHRTALPAWYIVTKARVFLLECANARGTWRNLSVGSAAVASVGSPSVLLRRLACARPTKALKSRMAELQMEQEAAVAAMVTDAAVVPPLVGMCEGSIGGFLSDPSRFCMRITDNVTFEGEIWRRRSSARPTTVALANGTKKRRTEVDAVKIEGTGSSGLENDFILIAHVRGSALAAPASGAQAVEGATTNGSGLVKAENAAEQLDYCCSFNVSKRAGHTDRHTVHCHVHLRVAAQPLRESLLYPLRPDKYEFRGFTTYETPPISPTPRRRGRQWAAPSPITRDECIVSLRLLPEGTLSGTSRELVRPQVCVLYGNWQINRITYILEYKVRDAVGHFRYSGGVDMAGDRTFHEKLPLLRPQSRTLPDGHVATAERCRAGFALPV
ncbi:hypothetical protein FI667_g17058, partial [Globisporangium splendens]